MSKIRRIRKKKKKKRTGNNQCKPIETDSHPVPFSHSLVSSLVFLFFFGLLSRTIDYHLVFGILEPTNTGETRYCGSGGTRKAFRTGGSDAPWCKLRYGKPDILRPLILLHVNLFPAKSIIPRERKSLGGGRGKGMGSWMGAACDR